MQIEGDMASCSSPTRANWPGSDELVDEDPIQIESGQGDGQAMNTRRGGSRKRPGDEDEVRRLAQTTR